MRILNKIFWGLFVLFSLLLSCKSAKIEKKDIDLNAMADGVYIGKFKHMNEADVKVVIKNHRIEEIKLLKLDATKFGQKAKDSVPQRIIRFQTPYVDAVSGATEASNVIMNACVKALSVENK